MYQENIVLCGASAYEKKFYLNDDFASLPEQVKEELKIMCVLFTEDVGGVLTLEFDDDGNLELSVSAADGDILFDEIGSGLKIKQLQQQKKELFEALETYTKYSSLGKMLRSKYDFSCISEIQISPVAFTRVTRWLNASG